MKLRANILRLDLKNDDLRVYEYETKTVDLNQIQMYNQYMI